MRLAWDLASSPGSLSFCTIILHMTFDPPERKLPRIFKASGLKGHTLQLLYAQMCTRGREERLGMRLPRTSLHIIFSSAMYILMTGTEQSFVERVCVTELLYVYTCSC